MRRVSAVLPVFLVGCALLNPQASLRQKYYELQEAFIVATQALVVAKQNELISDEDWTGIVLPLIDEGNDLLDKMLTSLETGQDITFRQLMTTLSNVLVRMNQLE